MRSKRRILLKFSGEVLSQKQSPIDEELLYFFSQEIKKASQQKEIELALVCGGGNIFRARSLGEKSTLSRTGGDNMGMMATIINSLALLETLKGLGVKSSLFTATHMPSISQQFSSEKAKKLLSQGEVILIAGGTGNPFFTTDTAAILRALEIKADFVAKGTDVNGIFDSDPKTNKKAKMYRNIDYGTTLSKGLKVMDATAFALAKENKIPIRVFNINKVDSLLKVVRGEEIGTLVSQVKTT